MLAKKAEVQSITPCIAELSFGMVFLCHHCRCHCCNQYDSDNVVINIIVIML